MRQSRTETGTAALSNSSFSEFVAVSRGRGG